MQMISSEAGTRLAKAKVAMDAANDAIDVNNAQATMHAYSMAHYDFCQAAKDLADELVALGYHDLDGGEG